MTIGERIKQIRSERGMTQAELASAVGITKQAVYKYENGVVTNIPIERIEQLAAVLQIPVSRLIGTDYVSADEANELAKLVASGLDDETTDFQNKVVEVFSNIPRQNWPLLKRQAEILTHLQTHKQEAPIPVYFNDKPDKPVEEMTPEEIARAISTAPKAFEDAYIVLNAAFDKLNREGRAEAVKRVDELTQIPKYTAPDTDADEIEEDT